MVQLAERERLQPSLLDRLTDHARSEKRDGPDQQWLSLQALKQAVLRDLAWLLNTTNLATTEPDLAPDSRAAASTINFGIPGFTGMVAGRGRMTALEKSLTSAIRAFEPRIHRDTLRVRVREQRQDNPVPSLIFEIEGELWAQPVPQSLFLETSIELETRLAVVTDTQLRG